MSELELYRFITENEIEWVREKNERDEVDVFILVGFDFIERLVRILNLGFDEVIACMLKENSIIVWMQEICDCHNIEMKNVFID